MCEIVKNRVFDLVVIKKDDIPRPLQDEQLNPEALMGQRGNYYQLKFPHLDVKPPKNFLLSEKLRDMQLKAAGWWARHKMISTGIFGRSLQEGKLWKGKGGSSCAALRILQLPWPIGWRITKRNRTDPRDQAQRQRREGNRCTEGRLQRRLIARFCRQRGAPGPGWPRVKALQSLA